MSIVCKGISSFSWFKAMQVLLDNISYHQIRKLNVINLHEQKICTCMNKRYASLTFTWTLKDNGFLSGWFTPLLRDINLWPPLWCSMVMYSVTCSKSDITSCLLVGWFIVCWRMTRPCLEFLLRKLNWQMTLMNCKMLCVWHFDELVHSFFLKTFTSHIFENKFFFVCAVLAYLPFIF